MKKAIVLALVCMLAVCAFAAEKNVTFVSPSNMNGKTIAPGDYKVSYDIKGSTADVKLLQGKKVVATATGQVVENTKPAPYNAVVNQKNADGSNSVVEFQFANQKQTIRLTTEGTAAGK